MQHVVFCVCQTIQVYGTGQIEPHEYGLADSSVVVLAGVGLCRFNPRTRSVAQNDAGRSQHRQPRIVGRHAITPATKVGELGSTPRRRRAPQCNTPIFIVLMRSCTWGYHEACMSARHLQGNDNAHTVRVKVISFYQWNRATISSTAFLTGYVLQT